MPDFDKLFIESKGQPIAYKGVALRRVDKFPVKNGDVLLIAIESANRNRREGLCIDITGHCEYDGKEYKKGKGIRMMFWEDTAPQEIRLKVFTKQDFVWVENIWEQVNSYIMATKAGAPVTKQTPSTEYGHGSAAMIVEEIEGGRRYRCQDGRGEESFDDIVFTVRKETPNSGQ